MTYLICLFFPSFISLRKFISKGEDAFSIFMKYVYINISVNLVSFTVVWFATKSRALIDNNIMSIPFFVKYLFVSSFISLILPKIYSFFKNDFSIRIERQK